MGIQGLIALLEKASTSVNIRDLKSSVCVIDGNGWLHRACYACADQLYDGQHTDQYVHYCLRRTQMFIDAGIKPIVVFDGQKLAAKEVTHNNRQMIRHNVRQKIEVLLAEGQDKRAKELMRNCIEVTPKMTKNLINALRERAIDYIVAPFEADPQMAYLVNNGFADFVVTEDSDLLVYNCRLCLFKLDSNGFGKLIDLSLIAKCLGTGFDTNKLRHMSILSGCDYLPNIPGIGLQRAKKFFKMTSNTDLKKVLPKIPNYLKMSKRVEVSAQYVDDFIKADNTFKYQLVFCPTVRQLVPLMPYENGLSAEKLSYAGHHFKSSLGADFAFQYAIGNVDTKSLKIIDSFAFEPKFDSIWSQKYFNYKNKFTTNALVLRPLSGNVLKANEDVINVCHKRVIDCQTIDSQKRLKVSENRFTNCKELLNEYCSAKEGPKTVSTLSSDCTSSKQIYSRNIFKINNDFNNEITIQSKYFTNLSKQKQLSQPSTCDTIPLKTHLISGTNHFNVSQCSLNSSGNTNTDSTFGEALTLSDGERSEVSETSDEEIIAYNSYTKLKPKKSAKHLNSTFMSAPERSDISSYFM